MPVCTFTIIDLITQTNYIMKRHFISTILLSLFITMSNAQTTSTYILDMVHNNPGEQPYVTPYTDPLFLKNEGFNGAVPHWHINCAIMYSGYNRKLTRKGTKEYDWIRAHADDVRTRLTDFEKAGMPAYPFTDFLVFPESVWDVYGNEISDEQAGNRHRKPDIRKKRTQELLRFQIDEIFRSFPELDGITLRFGETYLHDTPYHMGNSPIGSGENKIDDHILLINILREQVCEKWNKKLFYRTWDFGYNFHNSPEFYLAVTDKVEPHPNLIFSIKYQQDDYHRMTPFNPCLGIGRHQQIVESQSRMEAYGKGAHPYYTAKGVIEGWPETVFEIEFGSHRFTGKMNERTNPRGLRDVIDSGLISGVVTWSNGGGWQGPYIKHEFWSAMNTYVVSRWMKNPSRSEEELFFEYASRNGIEGYSAYCLRQLALASIEGVRKGHSNSYAKNNMWWTRDEFFSWSDNKSVIKEIISKGVQNKVLVEKEEASAIWLRIEALSKQIESRDKVIEEVIRVSSTYGRIKYQLIEVMWKMMLEYEEIQNGKIADRPYISNLLDRYDALWKEWHQLKDSSAYCATLYTDMAFRNKKTGSIGDLAERMRKLLTAPQ